MGTLDYYSATLYGLIQGLTEFLPVSSSGHLALLPRVLGIQDPGVAFDLAMHIGTALAVLIYFKADVKKMVIEILTFRRGQHRPFAFYAFNLLVANFFTFVLAMLIKDFAEERGRMPILIAANLMVFGIFMWATDYFSKSDKDGEVFTQKIAWKESVLLGLFQGIAVFPGVSRSGSTLGVARLLKLDRRSAARFSFLMSLPVIFGGMLFHLRDLPANINYGLTLWGVVVSFLSGLFTIYIFMRWINRQGMGIFALYRMVVAALVFYFLY